MWGEFTKDICNNPKVMEATPEQHHFLFRHAANNLNEGALGDLRCKYCAYPNMTFGMANAILFCVIAHDFQPFSS